MVCSWRGHGDGEFMVGPKCVRVSVACPSCVNGVPTRFMVGPWWVYGNSIHGSKITVHINM